MLISLPACSVVSHIRCLELLAFIVSKEVNDYSPETVSKCLAEIKLSSWYFFHGLQFGLEEGAFLYIDLLAALTREFDDLLPKAVFYFEMTLNRDIHIDDASLLRALLQEYYLRIS